MNLLWWFWPVPGESRSLKCEDGRSCLWDGLHPQQQGTGPATSMGWGRAGAGMTVLVSSGKVTVFCPDVPGMGVCGIPQDRSEHVSLALLQAP